MSQSGSDPKWAVRLDTWTLTVGFVNRVDMRTRGKNEDVLHYISPPLRREFAVGLPSDSEGVKILIYANGDKKPQPLSVSGLHRISGGAFITCAYGDMHCASQAGGLRRRLNAFKVTQDQGF